MSTTTAKASSGSANDNGSILSQQAEEVRRRLNTDIVAAALVALAKPAVAIGLIASSGSSSSSEKPASNAVDLLQKISDGFAAINAADVKTTFSNSGTSSGGFASSKTGIATGTQNASLGLKSPPAGTTTTDSAKTAYSTTLAA